MIWLIAAGGRERYAAKQMRALFHPVKKIAARHHRIDAADFVLHGKPGVVDVFPHLAGNGAAHRTRIFTSGLETVADRRRMLLVPRQKCDHVDVGRGQVGLGERGLRFGDDNWRHRSPGISRAIKHGERLRDV